jgi:hypothetical protein
MSLARACVTGTFQKKHDQGNHSVLLVKSIAKLFLGWLLLGAVAGVYTALEYTQST